MPTRARNDAGDRCLGLGVSCPASIRVWRREAMENPLCRSVAGAAACGSALFYVASMSQGIAGNVCKPLKQHGNRLQHCDMETRGVEVHKPLKSMATPAGFEPATFSLEGCCS